MSPGLFPHHSFVQLIGAASVKKKKLETVSLRLPQTQRTAQSRPMNFSRPDDERIDIEQEHVLYNMYNKWDNIHCLS